MKVMKLSEAIRLGSMMKPQQFGSAYDLRRERSCALAAAFDAVGVDYYSKHQLWTWRETEVNCPVCEVRGSVFSVITHINDIHLWTRERIADWVETVEPKEESNQETKYETVGSYTAG